MITGTITAKDFVEGKSLEQACFEFLDKLRASGLTNMYGAAPYLIVHFNMDRKSAREMLTRWMQTFSDRRARGEVVA